MTTYLMKLSFPGPVHIGADDAAIGVERTIPYIHSDTLFSAICNVWGILFGKENLEEILKRFDGEQPPFLLSSAFFYSGESYYLPRPLTDPIDSAGNDQGSAWQKYHKELKRTSFINIDTFSKWTQGGSAESLIQHVIDDRQELKHIFHKELTPHVTVDRIFNQPNLYFSGQVRFRDCSGLYFLLQLDDSTFKDKLSGVLEYLQDVGLGGEKSTGCGKFILETAWEPIDKHHRWARMWREVHDNKEANARCLLSLFYPNEQDELDKENLLAYNLVPRRGWAFSSSLINHSLKRQSVWMLGEGSVVKAGLQGGLAEVTPKDEHGEPKFPHAVYRYGCIFSLPIKASK